MILWAESLDQIMEFEPSNQLVALSKGSYVCPIFLDIWVGACKWEVVGRVKQAIESDLTCQHNSMAIQINQAQCQYMYVSCKQLSARADIRISRPAGCFTKKISWFLVYSS